MSTAKFYELAKLSSQERRCLMSRTEEKLSDFLTSVDPIIEAVRLRGDDALVEYTARFDGAILDRGNIRARPDEFSRAFEQLDKKVLGALTYAIENITTYHETQMPQAMWLREIRPGVFAGERHIPIDAVACYVPRGKGSFPSTVMMLTVPAAVAGVARPIIVTPPGPDGQVDAATLVVAQLVGITEVYKCGGAQAVAAVAFGTTSVPKCDKIIGPGSPWVIAAKQRLAGVIDPGIPAGPSECIVLADAHANPSVAALDLVIEAEHGPDSSAFLVTDCPVVAEAALRELDTIWAHMGERRAGYAKAVLGGERGGVVLADDMEAALDFVNQYAPEHLALHVRDPFEYLGRIRNASEILLGQNTPISIANYVLGPNAVLPTSMAAKTMSPLSVLDFMRRSSVGYVTACGYADLAGHTQVLAKYEGFDAHALAVSDLRMQFLKRK